MIKLSREEYAVVAKSQERMGELLRELRALPEEEAFLIVSGLLKYDDNIYKTLSLAKSCLHSHTYFRRILEMGLARPPDRTIQWWLDCVVPKVGFIHTVEILTENIGRHPIEVSRARYYLAQRLPSQSPRAIEALRRLDVALESISQQA